MLPTGMQLSSGKVANYWLLNHTHAHEFISVPFFLIKKATHCQLFKKNRLREKQCKNPKLNIMPPSKMIPVY